MSFHLLLDHIVCRYTLFSKRIDLLVRQEIRLVDLIIDKLVRLFDIVYASQLQNPLRDLAMCVRVRDLPTTASIRG